MSRQEGLIVITGPTGSGKTALAIELSERHAIEVISADSMQVYCHMDIATAKPSKEEQAAVNHHLIDIVNPDEGFNAAMFVRLAREKIVEVKARGRIPVVVGGTGLYIKALIYGLVPAPERSERIRRALRAMIEKKGVEYLEAMLQRLDPVKASRIRKNDAVRVIRSLEIIFQTGYRTSLIHAAHGFQNPLFDAKIACIMPERDRLFCAINRRVLGMIEAGLEHETRMLLAMGYNPGLRPMQALAYKHVIRYLNGEIDLDEAVRLIQRDTRRFAKRQITWIRSRPDHSFFDSLEKAYDAVSQWLGKSDTSL